MITNAQAIGWANSLGPFDLDQLMQTYISMPSASNGFPIPLSSRAISRSPSRNGGNGNITRLNTPKDDYSGAPLQRRNTEVSKDKATTPTHILLAATMSALINEMDTRPKPGQVGLAHCLTALLD
jgi:hypothetical protein